MKKLFIFILLMGLIQVSQAQKLIESFDNAVGPVYLDPPVLNDNFFTNGPGSYCFLGNDTAHVEGTGSMRIDYHVQAQDGWGGYVVRTTYKPGATDALPYMDMSGGTHLRLRYKITNPALMTAAGATSMEFKMAEIDGAGLRDLWLHKININFADATGEWIDVDIPLEVNADNTKGFTLQFGDGDKELQLEHIKGFEFALVFSNSDGIGDTTKSSTGSILWDNLTLEGKRSIPTVFFAGKALPAALGTGWGWGQSTVEIVEGAGPVPELNAIKWVQGNEWSNGWTGIGFTISPALDMSWSWVIDTLQFKMKAEEGVGLIRIQLNSGSAKRGWIFQPTADNQWHTYRVALNDLIYPPAETAPWSPIDSSKIDKLDIEAEATGIAGKVIYLSEIWTGNPKIDVVPPKAVTGLSVVPGTYSNLITWTDVAGEAGEVYDVYYSDQPISDIANAKLLKGSVPENTQIVEQLLRTPNTDQNLTYYYAIVCKDAFVNISPAAFYNTATTNAGKGVPTIGKAAPANFVADGDLSEWKTSSIPEIRIYRSEGTGFDAPSGLHDGDADYSLSTYLAFDADNLYFAADVTDDIYSWKKRTDPWMNDAINLYIGLYDENNTGTFTSYKRGATPHYEIRFDEERVTIGNSDSLLYPGANYFFGQKSLSSGYYFEAKISLADLATKRNSAYSGVLDDVFHPAEGMKIGIDFSCNDADATGDRELVFCYSSDNKDQSWNNPSLWAWTWIGNKMTVGVEDGKNNNVVSNFNLDQNYPNPFNPSTKISYAIQSPELVTLRVFDVLGREVAMLVNQYQTAGSHSVSFDASSLASGMYFYKLEAGSFQSIKKMMLLK